MTGVLTEKDWNYMRVIHDELLSALCTRINGESATILASKEGTAHQRYLNLYKHIQASDVIIGDCFNDLKRSNLGIKLMHMKRQGLLTPEQLEGFSQGARDLLNSTR